MCQGGRIGMKTIKIKVDRNPSSILKESNEERIARINSSRRLSTQTVPNKKKLSRAQQKQLDHKSRGGE